MKSKKTKIKFIDVSKYGFVVEPRYWFFGWSKSSMILARESVAKKLVEAKKLLSNGYNFKIWDCKRSYKVQALMISSFRKRLRFLYPDLSSQERKKLLLKFGATLMKKVRRLDTHRRGGSFDLTIIDGKKRELYMGTDHDDLTEKAATDYFERKKNLTALEKEARRNRRLFKKALEKAGFKNYAAEWWHWSYDK